MTWSKKGVLIEFQKRGVPHAHVLLTMRHDHEPRTAREVDHVVPAELPDKNDPEQREPHDIVATSTMHGPCGVLDPSKPCANENGCCTKRSPCNFALGTVMQDEKYPTDRRRDNGRCVTKRGVALDNRWVVPYNPIPNK